MIDPPRPPSMIFWAPAITVFQVPVTLVSSMSLNGSGVVSYHGSGTVIPALATITSSRPNSATPFSTAAVSAARSLVSAAVAWMRLPVASTSRTVSARSSGVAESYGTLAGVRALHSPPDDVVHASAHHCEDRIGVDPRCHIDTDGEQHHRVPHARRVVDPVLC